MVKRLSFVLSFLLHSVCLGGLWWYSQMARPPAKPLTISVQVQTLSNPLSQPAQPLKKQAMPTAPQGNFPKGGKNMSCAHEARIPESKSLPQTEILYASGENHPPNYPPQAIRRGVEGTVLLKAYQVDKEMYVSIMQSSGHESLDQAALHAVKQWQLPEKKSAVVYFIPIEFRLQ